MMMNRLRSDSTAFVYSNGVNVMNPYHFRKGENAVTNQQLAVSLMEQVYAAPAESQPSLAKQLGLDNDPAGPYMIWDALVTGHVDVGEALSMFGRGPIFSAHGQAWQNDLEQSEIEGVLKSPPEGKIEAIEKFLIENPHDGSVLLYKAAVHGDEAVLNHLIEAGHDIHPENSPSIMPLHAACYNGRLGAAQLLVHADIDVDHLDEFGGTPLMRAAAGSQIELVRWLLENGADAKIRETRSGGSTALELGMSSAVVAQLLLDNGAEWTPTAFASAVHRGDKNAIKIMSDTGGFVHYDATPIAVSSQVNLDDHQREAVLLAVRHCASAQAAPSEIVHWLLRHIAISHNNSVYELDPNDQQVLDAVRGGIRGAVRNDDVATARLLINSMPHNELTVDSSDKSDVHLEALGEWLFDAINSDAILVTRMLLEEYHIDPNVVAGPKSETPLTVAAQAGHVELIKLLVTTFGASIHKASGAHANGPTPLWHAIRSLNEAAARTLLDHGGPVEKLHAAIEGGEKRLWLSADKDGVYRAPVTLAAWISPNWYDEDLDERFMCLEFNDGFHEEVFPRIEDDELLAAGDKRPLATRPEQ